MVFLALYACDDDDYIFSTQAKPGKVYWCLECFLPVKVRRSKNKVPHFYHLKSSPTCRLYSKSEEHLRAQIQIQKMFPEGEIQMERPFLLINRVADLCWERKKIIFEIQCSLMTEAEAFSRIHDYRSAGYEVVWLLDEKKYNQKTLRPSEEFLRQHSCYYITIRRGLSSDIYDQFEIFSLGKRVKRGRKMEVDLRKPCPVFSQQETFPKQIKDRIARSKIYFYGDRLDKIKKGQALSILENWRVLEAHFAREEKLKPWKEWLSRWVLKPYSRFLETLFTALSKG